MILIIAVDDNNGLAFNRRRQSQDRILREKILNICKGNRLWVTPYSAKQFDGMSYCPELNVSDEPLQEAVNGEYVFAENMLLHDFEKWIEKIIVFRWNRCYPSDLQFDIDVKNPARWKHVQTEDFAGFSHDKITMDVYERIVSDRKIINIRAVVMS